MEHQMPDGVQKKLEYKSKRSQMSIKMDCNSMHRIMRTHQRKDDDEEEEEETSNS